MPTDETERHAYPRPPGSRTPLQKAIGRSLVNRASGWTSLRANVLSQLARWRLEGVPEHEILPRFLEIASDMARETGNDRVDLISGEPRWSHVADAIARVVDSARLDTSAVA